MFLEAVVNSYLIFQGYQPADFTVHPPPPKKKKRLWVGPFFHISVYSAPKRIADCVAVFRDRTSKNFFFIYKTLNSEIRFWQISLLMLQTNILSDIILTEVGHVRYGVYK